ncbi:MAG: protein kinase [Polyangiaceae bacterium]
MATALAGTLLGGRYRLERPLAEGGMGEVWRAFHEKLEIPVAVKRMAPALAASASARARFEREAKAAAKLSSPHVVEVFDYGVEDDAPYIVMELLEGEDLASRLDERTRLDPEEACSIVGQIAKALDVAHAMGIVHRDLKPANVFLARKGNEEIVKVLDFGIAKLHAQTGAGTMPGTLVGSPGYMSPEQARGDGNLDHRSDLWALGVLAFRCLTGRMPFVGEDVTSLLRAIAGGEIPRPTAFVEALSDSVDRFFEKAFSRPREARFQTARDLAASFRDACGLRPVSGEQALFTSSARSRGTSERSRDASSADDGQTIDTGARAARAFGARASISPPPALASSGDVLVGRFGIERVAGEGGMGVVYRAKDNVTGQPVALKLLRAATFDADRFFREARVLSEVRHPGVVGYVAHGVTAEGQPYIAMEWLEGGDLEERLRQGRLPVGDALLLGQRIAEALGAAHRRGVVHGDLKPSNVLLGGGDLRDAKVIDFGIARLSRRASGPGAREGLVFGTPGYMAPEQVRGEADVDARADVFALGCLLFECLTGCAPFHGESPIAAMARTVNETAPRAAGLVSGVADEVDALLARLLSRERDRRPADGAACAEAIHDLARSLGVFSTARRASITSAERKLLPAILLLPSGSELPSFTDGIHLAEEVASEDATWEASGPAIELAARVGPIARRFQAQTGIVQSAAVSVLFDGAGALSDLATRAAACALALRSAEPLATIAIATGRRGVRGDVLDRAAETLRSHLARAAAEAPIEEPAPVAIDDTTFGLLEGRFEVEASGTGFALLGRLRPGTGDVRPVLGKKTPCAGRELELGMLDALYRQCVDEPAAKAAVLKGPGGVGKSRVRVEMLRRLAQQEEPPRVWIGRGDVMTAGSPFALLSQAILAMLELSGGEPTVVRAERLAARVAERVPEVDRARVTAFLGNLIGLPLDASAGPEVAAAKDDALLLGDQHKRAFQEFVAAECSAGPVVLVLEDLHLGDLPTVKLVDATLRALSDQPLFVLATARPEVDDLFPSLWEERVPQVIRVGPLSAKASEKLVRHALGASAAPDLVARIVARAAGHPLHLEEIVRAVAERDGGELPDTVLSMVEARIGALDPAARRVLRAASVFGRTFWEGAVVAMTPLAPAEVRSWLRELVDREWISRAQASKFPGEAQMTIAQDLVQEAAYAMLPEADREVGHRLAGEWLVRAGERDATVLARHFSLGNDPGRAAGFLLRAAEQALDGNDFALASEHATRATAMDPSPVLAGRAAAILAEAHGHRGEMEAAARRGAEALALVVPTDPAWFRACSAHVVASGRLGDMSAISAVAARLVAMDPDLSLAVPFAAAASNTIVQLVVGGERAESDALHERLAFIAREMFQSDPMVRAYQARTVGARAAFSGDPFGAIAALRETAAAFEVGGDIRQACSARKTLGWYLGECGALEEAERSLRDAITAAARLGLTNLAPHAKHDLGSPLLRLGKLDEARRSQEEALVEFEAQRDVRLTSSARALLAAIAVADGRVEDAEREASQALASAPTAATRFTALARLAEARAAAGRHDEAIRTADEALAILAEKGAVEECVVVCMLARATSLIALGRDAEADAMLLRADREIEESRAKIRDPELAESFLSRIPENARVQGLLTARGLAESRLHSAP